MLVIRPAEPSGLRRWAAAACVLLAALGLPWPAPGQGTGLQPPPGSPAGAAAPEGSPSGDLPPDCSPAAGESPRESGLRLHLRQCYTEALPLLEQAYAGQPDAFVAYCLSDSAEQLKQVEPSLLWACRALELSDDVELQAELRARLHSWAATTTEVLLIVPGTRARSVRVDGESGGGLPWCGLVHPGEHRLALERGDRVCRATLQLQAGMYRWDPGPDCGTVPCTGLCWARRSLAGSSLLALGTAGGLYWLQQQTYQEWSAGEGGGSTLAELRARAEEQNTLREEGQSQATGAALALGLGTALAAGWLSTWVIDWLVAPSQQEPGGGP